MALKIADDLHLQTTAPAFVQIADVDWDRDWGPLIEHYEPPPRAGVVAPERESDDPPLID